MQFLVIQTNTGLSDQRNITQDSTGAKKQGDMLRDTAGRGSKLVNLPFTSNLVLGKGYPLLRTLEAFSDTMYVERDIVMSQIVTKVRVACVQFRPRNLRHHYQNPVPRALAFRVSRDPSQSRSWEFLTSRCHWPKIARFRHYM